MIMRCHGIRPVIRYLRIEPFVQGRDEFWIGVMSTESRRRSEGLDSAREVLRGQGNPAVVALIGPSPALDSSLRTGDGQAGGGQQQPVVAKFTPPESGVRRLGQFPCVGHLVGRTFRDRC